MNSRKACKRPPSENEYDQLRKRRRRTAFTDEQLNRMEDAFQEERFPGIHLREKLAQELNIGEDRIKVWFQNRRSRWRRHEIKSKPASPLSDSTNRQVSSPFVSPAMFQPSPASFPPWSPIFSPFLSSSSALFPTNGLATPNMFPRLTSFPHVANPTAFHRNTSSPCAASQTVLVSVMLNPRVSASVSPSFSSDSSLSDNLKTQNQASCSRLGQRRGSALTG
ncbi:Retinal homeobox protein Rx2 [Stylophora pistillata]|uniref:Retinal homeobox protein Rx2 n=2 Tax=Stylophora pistillata TaxID=50429 RepID=A0A2B4SMA4_STYPI|nr:Retinal homeobox protein Rx2 [Stylophora pistillata]